MTWLSPWPSEAFPSQLKQFVDDVDDVWLHFVFNLWSQCTFVRFSGKTKIRQRLAVTVVMIYSFYLSAALQGCQRWGWQGFSPYLWELESGRFVAQQDRPSRRIWQRANQSFRKDIVHETKFTKVVLAVGLKVHMQMGSMWRLVVKLWSLFVKETRPLTQSKSVKSMDLALMFVNRWCSASFAHAFMPLRSVVLLTSFHSIDPSFKSFNHFLHSFIVKFFAIFHRASTGAYSCSIISLIVLLLLLQTNSNQLNKM